MHFYTDHLLASFEKEVLEFPDGFDLHAYDPVELLVQVDSQLPTKFIKTVIIIKGTIRGVYRSMTFDYLPHIVLTKNYN